MVKSKVYKSLNKHYPYDRGYCTGCGKVTTSKLEGEFICKQCQMALDDKLTEDELEIVSTLRKSKLTPEEIRLVLRNKPEVPQEKKQPYSVQSEHVRIGVISDTHIGSKFYDPQLMKYAAQEFNKKGRKGADFVVHVGDITEGHYENKRQGSVFELTEIGGDAQVKRAVKELSQIKKPIYAITGNHEHNTFFKLAGFDIGEQLQEKMPNLTYLGNMQATINLPHGKKLELLHPGGGSSYALSYKPQKIVESLEGGTKPDILLIGHFHKSLYMYYRNVHTLMPGTLQSQTSFMREKGLSAHKGFYILDVEVGKNGIRKMVPEFFPAY
jgi:predicted phosphodiesterase